MYHYFISGLHVSSELELRGAILREPRGETDDVSIRRGSVPLALDGATATGPTWDLAGDIFLLRVPRLIRFRIEAGRDIVFETEPGFADCDAAGFVLGTAFGILLHQRGSLVLHGSAVAKDGRSIAICGYSGAGKSTLAAALCGDGCSFVADDICVVGLDGRQRPMILPDGRHLKLWKESIDHLGLAERRGRAVRESFAKYYVDPPDPHAQPSPLSAVYVLREARPSLKEGVERLSLPDAMRTLDHEAYRPRFRAKLQPRPQTMAHVAAVLSRAKVFRLVRPRGFEHLQDTVAAVLAHWDSLG
jgi:hypothetical protein